MKFKDKYFNILYHLHSSLGDIGPFRYINQISGTVTEVDEQGNKIADVGHINLNLILISLALDTGYDIYEVFDYSHSTMEIGDAVFDFNSYDLVEPLQEYYDYTFLGSNICIVDRIEILPKYRGKGLGKKIVKDMYNRFGSGCCIFVLKCFPVQFEHEFTHGLNKEWFDKMKYQELEPDEEKAFYQLANFYKKCGWSLIPDVSKELMFLNPALKNPAIEKIEL